MGSTHADARRLTCFSAGDPRPSSVSSPATGGRAQAALPQGQHSDGEPYDDIDARPQIPASRAQLALMFVALVAFAVAIVLALAR